MLPCYDRRYENGSIGGCGQNGREGDTELYLVLSVGQARNGCV